MYVPVMVRLCEKGGASLELPISLVIEKALRAFTHSSTPQPRSFLGSCVWRVGSCFLFSVVAFELLVFFRILRVASFSWQLRCS